MKTALTIGGSNNSGGAGMRVKMAIQYGDGQDRGAAPVNVLAFAPKKK